MACFCFQVNPDRFVKKSRIVRYSRENGGRNNEKGQYENIICIPVLLDGMCSEQIYLIRSHFKTSDQV
jgi:hypothetical protein